jgi:hypothetical protein
MYLVTLYGGTVLGIIAVVPSAFVLWLVLNMVGYCYVSLATEERPDPLLSRYGNYKQFVYLVLASPITYWLAPAFTLLPDDTQGPVVYLTGLGNQTVASSASFTSYFLYSAFAYALPFFIGLHFTYLDFSPWFQKIEINDRGLRAMGASHWLFLASVIELVLPLVAYHVYLFYHEHLLYWYLLGLGIFILVLVTVILVATRYGGYRLHIHHYQLFGALLFGTRFQNVISAVTQALLAGMYVEGVARWGMDPLLIKPRPR